MSTLWAINKAERAGRIPFSLAEARAAGMELGVNLTIITPKMLMIGMNVELEHGLVDRKTNVTGDDTLATAKIALAHYTEGANYYDLLEKMEEKLVEPSASIWLHNN